MTSIEWTDETWNPLAGCTRASAGRLLDGREWNEYPEVTIP